MTVALDSSMDWQIETIRAFVVKQKRDRYVEKVLSPKKRAQFVKDLAHFADFDLRYVVQIPPSLQHASAIESLLRAKGAPATCQIISEISTIDSARRPLADALRETIGRQMGTILCCISGHLAFFENEDGRFILERKS